MPVETFAAFATEQALGIAVGAIAVVAAPTVGPKLGAWSHNLVDGTKAAAFSAKEKSSQIAGMGVGSSAAALTTVRGTASKVLDVASDTASRTTALVAATPVLASTAMAKPLSESSQKVYGGVVGGARWYGEQWSDLVHEARAGLSNGEGATVKDVLTSLPDAKVTTDLPGRVRLRLPAIQGDKTLAEQIADSLGGISGIDQVQVNANSGSVLICYASAQFASLETLLQSVAD